VRLREKGGKRHAMPCHHNLEEYLTAHLDGAALRDDPKGPLFRTIGRGTGKAHPNGAAASERLCDDRPARGRGGHRIQARQSQLPGDRGVTAYLENGGTLEKAAAMANHASTRTTQGLSTIAGTMRSASMRSSAS
jgi:integrase/recombinase XerC